ncbi:MAG TPA: hypothetical protein VG755_09600 [Nannocystaceae bacterium]|nr:hypothetical protein [Nannocystaceae bacterium]
MGAAIAVAVSALAAQSGQGPAQPATASASAPRRDDDGYTKLIAALDDRIEDLQARADSRSDDWLTREHLGYALLERASLTQDPDDYARLQIVLDEAFEIAVQRSGPLLLAARYNVAIHRYDVAEDYLVRMGQRVLEPKNEQLAARVLKSQIAFQRGEFDEARALLDSVANVAPAAVSAELALYHAKTGDPERADALLAEAFASATPKDKRRRAWTLMQRGLVAMDRGAYLPALELLQEADAELSGWWLVQEHLAEVYDRLGQHGRALAIYEGLVATHGLPQHMDALARARRHAGENADELIAKSGAIWAELFERMPSSAIGHGLEHELAFGDPRRAVELAEANHALRPGGDAKVALARAYVAAGRPADARTVVRDALATPYRTAGLHRVAVDAHTALGETSAAAEQLALCVAINPSCESQTHTH